MGSIVSGKISTSAANAIVYAQPLINGRPSGKPIQVVVANDGSFSHTALSAGTYQLHLKGAPAGTAFVTNPIITVDGSSSYNV